jgi:GNAT superfamily N-acetyltransferase
MDVVVATEPAGMPAPEEVERLWRAASEPPPLSEPPSTAALYAQLYEYSRALPGLVTVSSRRDGELVGLAYGHPWSWATATDPWSQQLRERLGEVADEIDGAFAVVLLAVHPSAAGAGLGRRLLHALLDRGAAKRAWLQTTDLDTPARRLYAAEGWEPIGHGPDAPDGRPGLVLSWRAGAAG